MNQQGEGAGDEGMDQWTVDFDLKVFHRIVVDVFVELFGSQKTGVQRIVPGFLGESLHGVFQVTMGIVAPVAMTRNSHDSMGSGTPELFRSLQPVAGLELPVRDVEKRLSSGDVLLGQHDRLRLREWINPFRKSISFPKSSKCSTGVLIGWVQP